MNRPGLSRLLWRISLPIMFAQLSEILLHVTNTMFLARVGVNELAAIAIADSILQVFLVVPLGLVDGIQILTARYLGRGRPAMAGAMFRHGLLLALVVASLLGAALGWGAPVLAGVLVSSRPVGGAATEFLRVACLGLPLTAASFTLSALLVSLGRTRALVPAPLALPATIIGLHWLLICAEL